VPQVRQSVPVPKMIFFDCFPLDGSRTERTQLNGQFKTIVGATPHRFRPRYALANLGHPSSSYWVLLGDRLLPNGVLTLTLKPDVFSIDLLHDSTDCRIPQRLKPDSLQSVYVRPKGRTLQKNEFSERDMLRLLFLADRFRKKLWWGFAPSFSARQVPNGFCLETEFCRVEFSGRH
jgi:hypothetical protein